MADEAAVKAGWPVEAGEPVKADEPTKPVKPDAIWFPDSWKAGRDAVERLQSVQTRLGPILGGRVYSRTVMGTGGYLASLSPDDTYYRPRDHPHAGTDRYRWEDQADGTRFGYLLPDDQG